MDEREENLYFDEVDYDNNVTRHLTPPKFIAGETCIRMFFMRYELFRNTFNQNWSDALNINILCNFVCDKTLLVIFNFPPEVQDSYERTKRYLITYFSSGETNDMLWHELNCKRQKLSQTVIEYFNELLMLNKVLQVPRHILKQIFVVGLRPEIQSYLGLHECENLTLQQVYYLAKKFETVNNSEIFQKNKVCNVQFGEQWYPHCMVPGEYSKENYAPNYFEQGSYVENCQDILKGDDNTLIKEFFPVQSQKYETGNFNNFRDNSCANVQNECSYPKTHFNNYTDYSPRCAMVQVNSKGSDFEFREMKKRKNILGNLSIQNNKNRSLLGV